MAKGLKYIWGRHGIYALLNRDTSFTSKRVRVLKALYEAFGAMNADDGALIFALATPDAISLYKLTFQAETYADKVLMDPNATIEEIALAIKVKFELSKSRMYLMMRDDAEEILNSARGMDKKWEEYISPFIEGHVESGALSKDDLADGLLR